MNEENDLVEQEQDGSIFEELYEGGPDGEYPEQEEAAGGEAAGEAKRENEKALPKFLLIVAGSLLAGGLLGFALVTLSSGNFGYTLASLGVMFTNQVAGWGLIVLPAVELVVCLPLYAGARRRLEKWDGEDEDAGGKIEAGLSKGIWISGMILILGFFLLAALVSGFANTAASWQVGRGVFFGGLAAFFVAIIISVILQQNFVDTQKLMNPEKKGSVYDVNFQKKWLDSCDEAERAIIGQCAFQAYRAMTTACLALWTVFALGGMLFDWGFLPALGVCVIWGVGQSVYSYSCIKWSGTGKPEEKEEKADGEEKTDEE